MTKAQGNLQKSKITGIPELLHLQFRTEDSIGYYSTNTKIKLEPKVLGAISKHPKVISWSGSGVDNYMEMEIEPAVMAGTWYLTIPKLQLKFKLVSYAIDLTQIEWSEDEPKKEEIEEAGEGAGDTSEIPF